MNEFSCRMDVLTICNNVIAQKMMPACNFPAFDTSLLTNVDLKYQQQTIKQYFCNSLKRRYYGNK